MRVDVNDSEFARRCRDLAAQLSVDSIRATTEAGSGHPTSSMSAAHLVAVLLTSYLRYDPSDPKGLANDRFVLSKGHASPLLYAALKAIGAIDDDELLSFRKLDSPLQGHPAPVEGMPWVDVATGSLGQGLPMGLGMALAIRGDALPGRVWVLMGDSEMMEGSVWEAMAAASHHRVANLIAIIDMNGLGQRGPTMLGRDSSAYARRARAFGWRAIEVDGHDVAAIDNAYAEASDGRGPTLIVARTEKGHGASFLAGKQGWHGKALTAEDAERAIAELGGPRSTVVTPPRPPSFETSTYPEPQPEYRRPGYGNAIATRQAFGECLAALAGVRPNLVVLDAEVANSTHADEFEKAAPSRFFEMYIGEQNMVGAAMGMQALGKTAFAATFGAFLTRAYDFIRMAAVGRADLRLCGSHAGASIGEDGPSQMALEDLAMMRAINGSTVVYPADGNATVRLVEAMADRPGVSYLRTTREKTPLLYRPDEDFEVGGSKTLRAGNRDKAVLIGAGVTLFEALKAADILEAEGIPVRVIDAYSVKPIDAQTIRAALADTGLMVVVEDHWVEGGIGDAVLDALADQGRAFPGRVVKLAVRAMPGSGSAEELRERADISATAIAEAVRNSHRTKEGIDVEAS